MLVNYWKGIPSQSFTADGSLRGEVTVASTSGFKTNQQVVVRGTGLQSLQLRIKKIISSTVLTVGPDDHNSSSYTDLSAYILLTAPSIESNTQFRFDIPAKTIQRAVYEEEPTVAIRTILVDEYGDLLTTTTTAPKRALDVWITGGELKIENPTINVDLDAFPPNHDSVRVVGIDIGSTQRQIKVNTDGYLLVGAPDNPVDVTSNEAGDGSVAILKGIETDILSYNLPADTLQLTHWAWMGDKDVHFRLVIEDLGAVTRTIRLSSNSGANPSDSMDFPTPIKITGQADRIIKIKATAKLKNANAGGSINGYLL